MKVISVYRPKGHLTIYKRYYDGREDELIYDENNIITSGLAAGLSYLFAGSGSLSITDYQIRWFQLGVSGGLPSRVVVGTYDLSVPLSTVASYNSAGSKLYVNNHNSWKNGILIGEVFARIPFYSIQKASPTSVKFVIIVDKDSCNNLEFPLNEVGLYMQNPAGLDPQASILIAYRTFTSIIKTNDFGLVFNWLINF